VSWLNATYALAYFRADIRAMMALADRALALNPSFARGWYISGVIELWTGTRCRDRACRSFDAPQSSRLHRVIGNEAVLKLLLAIQEDSAGSGCNLLLHLFEKASGVEGLRSSL
jgi:hypothetical protein